MLFGLSKIWSLKLLVIKLDDTSCPRITQKSFNTPYYFCHQTHRSSQESKVYLQIRTVFLCHVQLSRCRPVSKQKFVTVWNRNVVFLMKFPSFSAPKFVIWKGNFPIFVTGCTAIMKMTNFIGANQISVLMMGSLPRCSTVSRYFPHISSYFLNKHPMVNLYGWHMGCHKVLMDG